jgi:tagatose 6-phosphate kinase
MTQSSSIFCFGPTPTLQRTLIFENLCINEVNRAKTVREFASGKAINVARVVQALGEKAIVTGFAGGIRGQMLRDDLKNAGVADQMVEVAAPTRLCCTLINRTDGTATELVEESAPVSRDDWQKLDVEIPKIAPASRIWVFSGSLPPDSSPDAYAKWAPLAQNCGAKLIIDARGPALQLTLQHPGIIAKINREELAATVQRDLSDPQKLQAAMLETTPKDGGMVVTAGKEGSWACDGKTVQHITSPPIRAVNPIGSGDSYAAGLAVGLLRNMDFFDACRLGTACAVANALTEDAGHVELAEINRLMKLLAAR